MDVSMFDKNDYQPHSYTNNVLRFLLQCQVIKVLTRLLSNFVSVELPRHRYCLKRQQDETYLTTNTMEESNT
jgi:hypothetical protein